MNEYFKYCSVQQLRAEINNRLAGAKYKLDQMYESTRNKQSVDRKFYNYVSQIKSKQRQYESILNEPSDLNCLLKRRRNKINESLEKYERNIKCKTISDFKFSQYNNVHPLQSSHYQPDLIQHQTGLPNKLVSLKNHTLLQNTKYSHPRSKTEANFFNKDKEENDISENSDNKKDKLRNQEGRNLRSITNVINIKVNQPSSKSDKTNGSLLTFAKTNTNQKKIKEKVVNAAKKSIRFETTPIQAIPQQIKAKNKVEKVHQQKEQKEKASPQAVGVKKIKQRIKANLGLWHGKKSTTKELFLLFEQQCIKKKELIQQFSNIRYQRC